MARCKECHKALGKQRQRETRASRPVKTQTCTQCGETKPARKNFARPNTKRRDGRDSWCRSCILGASTQVCVKCRAEKPREQCLIKQLKYAICKTCVNARHQQWAKSPSGRRAVKHHQLVLLYGITIDDHDAILAKQGGRCAICRTDTPGGPSKWYFNVDHDHSSGRVRGLVCLKCNRGRGLFRDSPALLRAAAAYLESFALPG